MIVCSLLLKAYFKEIGKASGEALSKSLLN
jgi:hypothetical protein